MDKPTHYLAIDCETTGLVSRSINPVTNVQYKHPDEPLEHYGSVSWGLCVVDSSTLDIVEELYVELSPFEGCNWNAQAVAVHKLSKEYLARSGIPEQDAVIEIAELILKYWGSDTPVILIGHNVHFDRCFLDDLLRRHWLNVRFSNRMIDTNTIGAVLYGTANSNELFSLMGHADRQAHNALEDAKLALDVIRQTRNLWRALLT